MATCWWAQAVASAKDFVLFEEAVNDVHWVIQELIRIGSLPPASNEPQQALLVSDKPQQAPPASGEPQLVSPASDKPQLVPSGSWTRTFSCVDGKRAVKPSQCVRDTL